MTLVLNSPAEFKAWRKANNKSLGFVPTMGALHIGHETLLQRARAENELLVLSIYVNPTQFNDKKDLENYPKTWDEDLKIAQEIGVDVVFAPNFQSIYPDNYAYVISENLFSKELCGASRPGHFDGVLTVVMKLLNIVSPTRAYFGEKDFQQLELIKGMAEAFFLDYEIIGVPTVREEDGLAFSSRNANLNDKGRALAPNIYRIIKTAKTPENAAKELENLGYKIDYVQDLNGRRLVAVKTTDTKTQNEVRLIDNVAL